METYKLTKTQKGTKFQYTVTDSQGNQISTRTSARDYVACTADGSYYFGRLDLIGKGDHGKTLRNMQDTLENPAKKYERTVASWMKKDLTFEEWEKSETKRAKSIIDSLTSIAYL